VGTGPLIHVNTLGSLRTALHFDFVLNLPAASIRDKLPAMLKKRKRAEERQNRHKTCQLVSHFIPSFRFIDF
jgi:hypothetical protein